MRRPRHSSQAESFATPVDDQGLVRAAGVAQVLAQGIENGEFGEADFHVCVVVEVGGCLA